MTNSSQNFMTIEEFINFAIQKEVEAAKFYRKMRELITHEEARELSILLEKEEIKHIKILKEFNIGAYKDGFLQFSPSFSLSMPEITSETPGVDEIIQVGIERERKASKIYENAASRVSGKFKDLLMGLATFERQHEEKLLSLKALL